MAIKFSADQAIAFMGIPDVQRLWAVTVSEKLANGYAIKDEVKEKIAKFKGTVVIDDDHCISDDEFKEFCRKFIIVIRELGI